MADIKEETVQFSSEELIRMIPTFAGFIELGRMYDLGAEELAKQVVNFLIDKRRRKNIKLVKGNKND